MKKIIKIIFPEQIKKILRKAENFFLRLNFGFTKPVILKNRFGINFILYPEQKMPIRWMIEEGAYLKEFSAIDQLVKIGDTIFDIGAHIGTLSSYFSIKAKESGKVYAFEPFPKSYNRLIENIVINDYKNIITNQIAISDKVGTSNFYYKPENLQLNSLGQVSDGEKILNDSIEVKVKTIDTYCEENNISKIDFLKIDTEGYEYNVLLGSEKMLEKKAVDVIQFEISKVPLESLGRTPEEIINFLKEKGYKTYEYFENTKKFKEINSIVVGYDNYYSSHRDLTTL